MTKIYIAFYDDEDGGSRENWNTFYTPWVAATTYEAAEQLAKDAIKANVYSNYNMNVDDDLDQADMEEEDREQLLWELDKFHIEIQAGELEGQG
jgi:hypothetical protein